jgi:hypothetical protein
MADEPKIGFKRAIMVFFKCIFGAQTGDSV